MWVTGHPHSGTSFHLTEQGMLTPAAALGTLRTLCQAQKDKGCVLPSGTDVGPAGAETEVDQRFRWAVLLTGTECPCGGPRGLWEQITAMAAQPCRVINATKSAPRVGRVQALCYVSM